MFKSLIKGFLGEATINLGQTLFLDNSIYHQLNNVTIKSKNGTTQIDHLIISIYGIFVTETKNYGGWIFGNKDSNKWTQSFYGKKNTFQNPLRQNYRHIKVLQEFLGLDESKFHSIVMFVGDSTFKTKMPENVLDRKYTSYIKNKRDIKFSEDKVQEILDAIKTGKLPNSFKTRREHISSLKERHNSTDKCPKCGNSLVERTAKRGQNVGNKFLGCSNFPKCRFVKNI